MKPKLIIILAAGAVLAISAFVFLSTQNPQTTVAPSPLPQSNVINLNEYSDSGQSGTATLTSENGKLKVVLELSGYNSTVPQPAHIHTGRCPRIGPVVHTLTDVVDDRSETILDTTFEELIAQADELDINVHESYDNFKTYTSCGDLK